MSRYIDADALIKTLNEEKIKYDADVNYFIMNAPTVDAVPIEQIEAFIDWIERNGYTLLKKAIIKALHDYRADGERRTDETEGS